MQPKIEEWNKEIAQIAQARGPSRMIMRLLLEEKLYVQAAELALGMESVFAMLGRGLDEVIAEKELWPERISFTTDLKPKIDEAHAEINFNCCWSQDILSRLPDTSETLAIRRSFRQVAIARNRLLNKLLSIHERYLAL